MPFHLVYFSQQDKQWKNDIPGFSDLHDTIGCASCVDGGSVRKG